MTPLTKHSPRVNLPSFNGVVPKYLVLTDVQPFFELTEPEVAPKNY